jgi:biotin carboxyl carrier protein
LKLHIEIDGKAYALDDEARDSASVEEVMPWVFSILLGTRSFTVNVAAQGNAFEVVGEDGRSHTISVVDARDRRAANDAGSAKGPAVIRAQMPGKIVTVLVAVGARVEAGQGLVVVEAMKMQNEVKAPKSGVVMKIHALEGATVTAGETLIVVE